MANKLMLKDLYLGTIDAKNELINESEDEIKRFEDSFLLPENIILDDFLNLKRYFIVGLKGTGKTALLRYLALKANQKINTHSTTQFHNLVISLIVLSSNLQFSLLTTSKSCNNLEKQILWHFCQRISLFIRYFF